MYREVITDQERGELDLSYLLDLRKIPASPDSPDERSSNFSASTTAMATSPSDKITCSSPLDDSGNREVLRKSSIVEVYRSLPIAQTEVYGYFDVDGSLSINYWYRIKQGGESCLKLK